jgi:hypothetical protein
MAEPGELNEVLQGRKVLSVEPGTTPGWMIINLELESEEREAQADLRLFLTVFIGGRKGSDDDSYYSTCALHVKNSDGRSTAHMVRDGRDPDMPMSSAYQALGDTKAGSESEPPNPEDL